MLSSQQLLALATSATLLSYALAQSWISAVAPIGLEMMTVGLIGDYGWTGWISSLDHRCLEVLPRLKATGIEIPNEVTDDCDPGDKEYIGNATALQTDTSAYVGQVCTLRNCSAFTSVGDNFYDSGIGFTTGGILRFREAWVDMHSQGVLDLLRRINRLISELLGPGARKS